MIEFTPRGRQDLDEIRDYTRANWGSDQARRYVGQIRDALNEVEARPGIGRDRSQFRDGLRSLRVRRHVIFYLPAEDDILVARILHERMDPGLHM